MTEKRCGCGETLRPPRKDWPNGECPNCGDPWESESDPEIESLYRLVAILAAQITALEDRLVCECEQVRSVDVAPLKGCPICHSRKWEAVEVVPFSREADANPRPPKGGDDATG